MTVPAPVAALRELAQVAALTADTLEAEIEAAVALVRHTVARRGTIFFCGNGGSAADAQHLATEYMVRFRKDRAPYPAIALTTDSSLLTAAGNDIAFEEIFARQVEALCKPGDLLVIHSTSGKSPNVIRAAEVARQKGVPVLALLAKGGGPLKPLADVAIVVPTDRSDRAQEIHICIGQLICEQVDEEI
jgi:D-sedoheptulose 7-phosphate isomerase